MLTEQFINDISQERQLHGDRCYVAGVVEGYVLCLLTGEWTPSRAAMFNNATYHATVTALFLSLAYGPMATWFRAACLDQEGAS